MSIVNMPRPFTLKFADGKEAHLSAGLNNVSDEIAGHPYFKDHAPHLFVTESRQVKAGPAQPLAPGMAAPASTAMVPHLPGNTGPTADEVAVASALATEEGRAVHEETKGDHAAVLAAASVSTVKSADQQRAEQAEARDAALAGRPPRDAAVVEAERQKAAQERHAAAAKVEAKPPTKE